MVFFVKKQVLKEQSRGVQSVGSNTMPHPFGAILVLVLDWRLQSPGMMCGWELRVLEILVFQCSRDSPALVFGQTITKPQKQDLRTVL